MRFTKLYKIFTGVFIASFVFSFFSTINSFASANVIVVSSAEIIDQSETVEVGATDFDDADINSEVTFHEIGDSVSYKIVLKNTDNKDHIIEAITDDNTNPYLSFTYDQYAGETIVAGETLDFILTVKYATGVMDMDARTQLIDLKVSIRFADRSEAEELGFSLSSNDTGESSGLLIPNTGVFSFLGLDSENDIKINMVVLVASSLGLLAVIFIVARKVRIARKIAVPIAASVLGLGLAMSVSAITSQTNTFDINSTARLYDKIVISEEGEQIVVHYGTNLAEASELIEPTREGYTFVGWEECGHTEILELDSPILEDIAIEPVFSINQYTISFDAGNGSAITTLTQDYNSSVTAPNDPEREGYTFVGWSQEIPETMPSEDMIIRAVWRSNILRMIYDGNGNDGGTMNMVSHENVRSGDTFDLVAPNYNRDGYGFIGWSTDEDAETDTDSVIYGPNQNIVLTEEMIETANEDGEIIMYAVWVPKEAEFTFQNFNRAAFEEANPDVAITALEDERDGQTYAVAKLADGKWWMIENLRFDPAGKTLDGSNTNNPTNAFSSAAVRLENSSYKTCTDVTSAACANQISVGLGNINGVDAEATPNGGNQNTKWYAYGAMYNWYTATAGNGVFSTANNRVVNGDICPAGWRLPTSRADNPDASEFSALDLALGGNGAYLYHDNHDNPEPNFPNNFVYSGVYTGSVANNRGGFSQYWGSTSNGDGQGYYFGVFRAFSSPYASQGRLLPMRTGATLRCVAK